MVFEYYDGRVDGRPCLDYVSRGGMCFAIMANDDGTTEEIRYDDLDYDAQYRRIGEPVLDASDEVCEKVRRVNVLNRMPKISSCDYRGVRIGDVVEVVKGRKYPKGTRFAVADFYTFRKNARVGIDYVRGINGERISADNVVIVGFSE